MGSQRCEVSYVVRCRSCGASKQPVVVSFKLVRQAVLHDAVAKVLIEHVMHGGLDACCPARSLFVDACVPQRDGSLLDWTAARLYGDFPGAWRGEGEVEDAVAVEDLRRHLDVVLAEAVRAEMRFGRTWDEVVAGLGRDWVVPAVPDSTCGGVVTMGLRCASEASGVVEVPVGVCLRDRGHAGRCCVAGEKAI